MSDYLPDFDDEDLDRHGGAPQLPPFAFELQAGGFAASFMENANNPYAIPFQSQLTQQSDDQVVPEPVMQDNSRDNLAMEEAEQEEPPANLTWPLILDPELQSLLSSAVANNDLNTVHDIMEELAADGVEYPSPMLPQASSFQLDPITHPLQRHELYDFHIRSPSTCCDSASSPPASLGKQAGNYSNASSSSHMPTSMDASYSWPSTAFSSRVCSRRHSPPLQPDQASTPTQATPMLSETHMSQTLQQIANHWSAHVGEQAPNPVPDGTPPAILPATRRAAAPRRSLLRSIVHRVVAALKRRRRRREPEYSQPNTGNSSAGSSLRNPDEIILQGMVRSMSITRQPLESISLPARATSAPLIVRSMDTT
ncbi:hypothetical protein THASP1DRAFT_27647 [Thamnocephalis sphaerospora]|uniref:Uncharacterized protein n=1 Tax=Thamnocephalis sphaerospora TaxID=78915 RepID=A0A4P9XW73_9FUNG|nr:hypothetical protein THASP1DRAFT_27647 [Thamnocephalis sphaerospora]|eukprot:RKP10554.1 hypothetical protein THASP1DRAFT_27647 [Thamnocephalis sphaerospora]